MLVTKVTDWLCFRRPTVEIEEYEPSSTANAMLVIGIGNEYARDDGAGLHVVRKLKETARHNFGILEHSGEGASLIEAWKGATSVIVIDAVRSGAEPGRVYRFDGCRAPLPGQPFRGSTHAFGLYEAVELARSLNQLPRRLIVYGIEGQDFTAGTIVSPAVELAIGKVAQAVLEEVEMLSRQDVLERGDGCTSCL
jgi:hydrogenase maturation protease